MKKFNLAYFILLFVLFKQLAIAQYYLYNPVPIKPGNVWVYRDWYDYKTRLEILDFIKVINNKKYYLTKYTHYDGWIDTNKFVRVDENDFYYLYSLFPRFLDTLEFPYYKKNVQPGYSWSHLDPIFKMDTLYHYVLDTIYTNFDTLTVKVKVVYFTAGPGSLLHNHELWSEEYGLIFASRPDEGGGPHWLIACRINGRIIGDSALVTSIDRTEIPSSYSLFQNYPNPFNNQTTIRYDLPKRCFVSVKVYDLLGRVISILVDEEKLEGKYTINFNSNNLPSGIYFYELKTNEFLERKKMILIK
jgi:hypothetical protein